MRNLCTVLCGLVLLCCGQGMAQLPDETNGRVPELDAFHKPIYTLWHTAWPAKDIHRLKELLPDVEGAYVKLAGAKLPGILRDKQASWDENLKSLAAAVQDYKASVATNDTGGILKATESVHMYYEKMVRVVRPVTKELDAFHQVLYMIHHYYMPEYDVAKLRDSADSLAVKMEALKSAELPKRLAAKTEAYNKSLNALAESVTRFVEGIKADKDKTAIAMLEEILHTRYQMVEKVFD
jgi:hypothetical protein